MPDVINEGKNNGALDDLGKIANTSRGPLDLAYKLREFEQGLDAAELAIAQEKENKNNRGQEMQEPDELLRGIQRDMGNER